MGWRSLGNSPGGGQCLVPIYLSELFLPRGCCSPSHCGSTHDHPVGSSRGAHKRLPVPVPTHSRSSAARRHADRQEP
eukprot:3827993-Amphidinium_carterae.1